MKQQISVVHRPRLSNRCICELQVKINNKDILCRCRSQCRSQSSPKAAAAVLLHHSSKTPAPSMAVPPESTPVPTPQAGLPVHAAAVAGPPGHAGVPTVEPAAAPSGHTGVHIRAGRWTIVATCWSAQLSGAVRPRFGASAIPNPHIELAHGGSAGFPC